MNRKQEVSERSHFSPILYRRVRHLSPKWAAPLFVAFASAAISGCSGSGGGGVDSAQDPALAKISEQLTQANTELAAHQVPLKIVDYEEVQGLTSDADVNRFKDGALDGSSMIPQYEGLDMTRLHLSTIGERAERDAQRPVGDLDVRTAIRTEALPAVVAGQRVLEITWESSERGNSRPTARSTPKAFATTR